jgi:two-component system sensor histidine kinase CpxA
MRSLFIKIFLWFWAATGLVVLTLFLSTRLTMGLPQRQVFGRPIMIYAATAARTFEREGPSALTEYLHLLEQAAGISVYVFDEGGNNLSGHDAPPEIEEMAGQVGQSTEARFLTRDSRRFVTCRTRGPSGRHYVVVEELPRGPINPFSDPRTWVLQLAAVLITVGVVCYWLARYLTAPVVKLRAATRQLAAGDLTTRVGRAVGKRHDELADLGRDFDLMAGRIESLVNAQRRLLGDISHELRSPLARLNVALGLARQRAGAAAGGALDRIEREAERLNELIGQLLMLTRLESGETEAKREPVDLSRLVNEIAMDADFEAQSHRRAVRIVNQEACATTGNARLLRSAIENVVRNAVRYTAEGTEVEIVLRCQRDNGQSKAVISVLDHGAGVPEAALADLFRPFYRVADARDRQTGGTGLGLAITERAVRFHGGAVKAANVPGHGLMVEIHLPATNSPSQ